MANGWIAWTCVMMTAGWPGAVEEIIHINHRSFKIPISLKADKVKDVRELALWWSRDQGAVWQIKQKVPPHQKAFEVQVPADSLYWFSIQAIDHSGRPDPPDVYRAPVGQKIHVDTTKPVVKILSAERLGDEIQVSWSAHDEMPKRETLKLEYQVGDVPGGQWTPLPISSERGNHRFRPGMPGEVRVRVLMQDHAGNEGLDLYTVPGFTPRIDRSVVGVGGVGPHHNFHHQDLPSPQPPLHPPQPVHTQQPMQPPQPPLPQHNPVSTMPTAFSTVATPGVGTSETMTSSAMPTRGALPPLQIVNKREIKLGFDVEKMGPSLLGSVEVYVTTDEGATWNKSPGDPKVVIPALAEVKGPIRGSVSVRLTEDGQRYGFYLVVKSGAGLGTPAPMPGMPPQVRVEVDTTLPIAELYEPQPDLTRLGSVLLLWRAEDRNIASNPISLEYSQSPAGPWNFIGEPQLPNTGRYTWTVPANCPPRVFLRLTVRDTAQNSAVAQTDKPVLIDLIRPQIGNVGIDR